MRREIYLLGNEDRRARPADQGKTKGTSTSPDLLFENDGILRERKKLTPRNRVPCRNSLLRNSMPEVLNNTTIIYA